MKKSRLYTTLNASIAMFLGGAMLLTTGFWLYNPENESIDLLPETGATTLTVCPDGVNPPEGCQYFGGDGIQQAVDAAKNGDTVLVKAGSYSRQNFTEYIYTDSTGMHKRKAMIVIKDKNITLAGEGSDKSKLDGAASTNMAGIVIVGTSNVTLKQLTIAGYKKNNDDCLQTDTSVACSRGFGIFLHDTAQASITSNTVSNNANNGIALWASVQATITNNTVSNNASDGIALWDSAQATIANNTVSNNAAYGIILGYTTQAVMTHNTVLNNTQAGIALWDSAQATIANNILSNNAQAGILLGDTAQATITNNTASNNGANGFFLMNSAQATFTNNIAYENDYYGITGPSEAVFTTLKYNLSFGNTEANWNDFPNWPPATNLTADPKFVSTTDFHLQAGSPAINAGDPAILDPDGSRSDIGAYGGPGACGLDPSLPGCVPAAPAPTALQITCDNGNANFSWNASTGVDKFILRVNHEPKNAQGGINTAQCKNPAGATVGWFCNTTTAGTQCLSAKGCDDQYKTVTKSTTGAEVKYTLALKPGEQYSWAVANQINGVEGAGAGSLDTNIFTCSTAQTGEPPVACKEMDINGDKKFDIVDLASFAQGYPNRRCTTPTNIDTPLCGYEDVNGDTLINIADFASFAQRYYTHHDSCAL